MATGEEMMLNPRAWYSLRLLREPTHKGVQVVRVMMTGKDCAIIEVKRAGVCTGVMEPVLSATQKTVTRNSEAREGRRIYRMNK